jgi:uncharacterized protein YbbK (DUF523 family)
VSEETVLVSKCLLGHACQFDGTAASRQLEQRLIERLGYRVVGVCPEELSGLPTPRMRMELIGGDGADVLEGRARVRTIEGLDLTDKMIDGAEAVLRIARQHGAKQMVARRRSPSCSCSLVPDGSFSGRFRSGVGITTALLQSQGGVASTELETIVAGILERTIAACLCIYRAPSDWTRKVEAAAQLFREALPLSKTDEWAEIFRDVFRSMVPRLHPATIDDARADFWDSDTVRFFQEVFEGAFGFNLTDLSRRCRICTYPEGFLDVYIASDGICSACKAYQQAREVLEDFPKLRRSLSAKLAEVGGRFPYDAIVACSGGKDSTYMLTKLHSSYSRRLLAVMDDLDQQNEVAVRNIQRACSTLGVDLVSLPPPVQVRSIRRNFLLGGSSFCRLCLRSHFARIYGVALQRRVPLVFFGLSRYQCLDCPDAIQWSLSAVRDVETPSVRLDADAIARRYKHRTFQGGFEAGFVSDDERQLLSEWRGVFDDVRPELVPLIVPFFVFDDYPDENELIDTIVREVRWEKPEMMLNHSNCRLLRFAGIFHKAVGRHHLNYKERATKLRFEGMVLAEKQAQAFGEVLETSAENESVNRDECGEFLSDEFGLCISDLPGKVQASLTELLKKPAGVAYE